MGVALYSEKKKIANPLVLCYIEVPLRKNHVGRFSYMLMTEALFEWI